MNYIEITCSFASGNHAAESSEIVIALLAELGCDSFEEFENAVKAYIPVEKFDAVVLQELAEEYPELIQSFQMRQVEQENWNHLWESNFPMTEIAKRVVVYAPFHTNIPDYQYRICIMPQMSFGTGHHETTALMIELMLQLEMSGKTVLDMGCGTGILAIFASMKNASAVTAIDIDEWAYRNTVENCERNGIRNIEILQNDSRLLANRNFDLLLANINRNVLLEDMSVYANCLPKDGLLQVSGFYTCDFQMITTEAKRNGLKLCKHVEKKNWVAAWYRKI